MFDVWAFKDALFAHFLSNNLVFLDQMFITYLKISHIIRSIGARNTGRVIRGSSAKVGEIISDLLLLIIRGHLRSIVVVANVVVVVGNVVVALLVIVIALVLLSIVVSVRVRPFALFVTSRVILPIAVSLIPISLLTEVINRREKQ